MFTRIFLLALLIFITYPVCAQHIKCGTVTPPNAKQLEQQFIQQSQQRTAQGITNCLNKTLSVRFIIVTDSSNNTGVVAGDITQSMTDLNSWFAPICLSFQVCDVDTVHSYKYNLWNKTLEEAEFRNLYAQMNVINIVLVETIEDPVGAAGYAPLGNSLSPSPHYDMIIIQKASLIGGTVPHEIGHFFGLYHTFETSLGIEFVNGSNCSTTGDLLCDTPADIDPAPIAAPCVWNGTNTDPNNDYYTPILGNIMSYHPGTCAGSLTNDQYNRMIFCYLNYRNYLY